MVAVELALGQAVDHEHGAGARHGWGPNHVVLPCRWLRWSCPHTHTHTHTKRERNTMKVKGAWEVQLHIS